MKFLPLLFLFHVTSGNFFGLFDNRQVISTYDGVCFLNSMKIQQTCSRDRQCQGIRRSECLERLVMLHLGKMKWKQNTSDWNVEFFFALMIILQGSKHSAHLPWRLYEGAPIHCGGEVSASHLTQKNFNSPDNHHWSSIKKKANIVTCSS